MGQGLRQPRARAGCGSARGIAPEFPLLPWLVPAVAEAANGLDKSGVIAELAPQRADRHLDHVAVALPLVTPQLGEKLGSWHGAPGALVQVAEEVVLQLRQRDSATVEPELAPVGIELGS
jgi:hypothetical protein